MLHKLGDPIINIIINIILIFINHNNNINIIHNDITNIFNIHINNVNINNINININNTIKTLAKSRDHICDSFRLLDFNSIDWWVSMNLPFNLLGRICLLTCEDDSVSIFIIFVNKNLCLILLLSWHVEIEQRE